MGGDDRSGPQPGQATGTADGMVIGGAPSPAAGKEAVLLGAWLGVSAPREHCGPHWHWHPSLTDHQRYFTRHSIIWKWPLHIINYRVE